MRPFGRPFFRLFFRHCTCCSALTRSPGASYGLGVPVSAICWCSRHRFRFRNDCIGTLNCAGGNLNRKLMWTYGGFIVFVILSLGVLTLCLHEEMLRGDRSAVFLAGFVDILAGPHRHRLFFFEHSDWPASQQFVVGHSCSPLCSYFSPSTTPRWSRGRYGDDHHRFHQQCRLSL